MFSKNRYGKRKWIEFMLGSGSRDHETYEVGIDLAISSQINLIQQYPLPDVEDYYNDDKFYTQHVVAEDWFIKEIDEYTNGYWDDYFDYLASRMNSDLPVLDVGCGIGLFMNYWNRNLSNLFAYGIEPSELAQIYSLAEMFTFNNFDDWSEWFNSIKSTTNLKDFNILMSLVLEHIPNPVEFIQQYLSFMGDTGTLTIVVPNDFSSLQKWIGSTHFIQDVHVNYFTPKSLLNTIIQSMPESDPPKKYIIDMSATFPMELFEVLGIHYIGNEKLGKKCHKFRLRFEKLFGKYAFRLYEKLFDKYGWGRELVFTVRVSNE